MTKPNDSFSLKSDAQAMEDAASDRYGKPYSEVTYMRHAAYIAGWQAARANQSVEVQDLVKALEFYADEPNYCDGATWDGKPNESYVNRDEGMIARQALARYKESGK